jgi:hypothetical protein
LTKEYAKNRTLIRTRWTQQIGASKQQQEQQQQQLVEHVCVGEPAPAPVSSSSLSTHLVSVSSSPVKSKGLGIDPRVHGAMQDAIQAYSITMHQIQDEWKMKYQQLQQDTSSHIRDLQNAVTFHIKQENELRTLLEIEKARNEALSSRLDVLVNEYAAEVAMNAENVAKFEAKFSKAK